MTKQRTNFGKNNKQIYCWQNSYNQWQLRHIKPYSSTSFVNGNFIETIIEEGIFQFYLRSEEGEWQIPLLSGTKKNILDSLAAGKMTFLPARVRRKLTKVLLARKS